MARESKGTKRQPQGKAVDKEGNVDQQKLKDNQDQLHVGQDHKTEEMRKQKRGTFP
jgi:hypothetical protein